jgi:hypothetical protein
MHATDGKTAMMGARSELGNLFNHSSGTLYSAPKWSLHKDPLAEEQRMRELGQDFAVVHRYQRYEVEEGEYAWRSHSIQVQSPRFRELLDEVFVDYPDWCSDGDPYTFFSPFQPLVHRWDRILKKADELDGNEEDKKLKAEIELLQKEVEPLISDHFSALKHAKKTGVIAWKKLWLVYGPGDLMVACIQGNICLTRLRRATMIEMPEDEDEPSYWLLEMDQYDWNGSLVGVVTRQAKIIEYGKEMLMTKLDVCPIAYVEGGDELRERTLARGRKFEALRGYHFKVCHGQKIVQTCMGPVAKPVSLLFIFQSIAPPPPTYSFSFIPFPYFRLLHLPRLW